MKSSFTALTRGFIAALALVTLGASAKADEVYSTFGPGNSYESAAGWSVSGPASTTGNAYNFANRFSVTQNFTLTGFEVAASHISGLNSYLFSIVSDNAGLPTGGTLFSTSGAISGNLSAAALTSFAATGSLVAGSTYWLVMKPGASDTWGGWHQAIVGSPAGLLQVNGGAWVPASSNKPTAFRINGTLNAPTNLTPEVPAGVQAVPVLLAVAGMALYQRRKQKASTL